MALSCLDDPDFEDFGNPWDDEPEMDLDAAEEFAEHFAEEIEWQHSGEPAAPEVEAVQQESLPPLEAQPPMSQPILPELSPGSKSASSSVPLESLPPQEEMIPPPIAPVRRRLRFKQPASGVPKPAADTIDGYHLSRHPCCVKYMKLPALERRKISKKVSQGKYRLIQDLIRSGEVRVGGVLVKLNDENGDAAARRRAVVA